MVYWRLALLIAQPFSVMAADRAKIMWKTKFFKCTFVPVACTSLFYYLRNR